MAAELVGTPRITRHASCMMQHGRSHAKYLDFSFAAANHFSSEPMTADVLLSAVAETTTRFLTFRFSS